MCVTTQQPGVILDPGCDAVRMSRRLYGGSMLSFPKQHRVRVCSVGDKMNGPKVPAK